MADATSRIREAAANAEPWEMNWGGKAAPAPAAAPAQPWEMDWSKPPPAPDDSSNFARGAEVAWGQNAPLLKGAVGLIGATGEKAFGEGGAFTALKNYGIKGYQEGMQKLQPLAHDNDELTTAWDKAKTGDLHALVDWASYGLGYGAGQIATAGATAVAGGLIGSAVAGPAGGVAGAAEGAVEGGAFRAAAQRFLAPLIAKEADKLATAEATKIVASGAAIGTVEEEAAKLAGSEVLKRAATANVAKSMGQYGAMAGYTGVQEAGSIYPEAEAEAKKNGKELTGADLARVWGATLLATGTEFGAEKLGLDAITGKIRVPGKMGIAGRAAVGTGIGGAVEGGTEAVQTMLERYGAGQEVFSPEGVKDIINSAGMGALPGGGTGLISGALHKPHATPVLDQSLDQHLADSEQKFAALLNSSPSAQHQVADVVSQPNADAAIAAAENQAGSMTELLRAKGRALAPVMDRQAVLADQIAQAPTEFDRQNLAAQAAQGLEANSGEPRAVSPQDFADLAPMDERTARGRLTVLRDQEARAGGNALGLSVVPHPEVQSRFAIGRQALPLLDVPIPQQSSPTAEETQQRLGAAAAQAPSFQQSAIQGLKVSDTGQRVAGQMLEDLAPGDRAAYDQTMRQIEARGGVATPSEATLVDRIHPGARNYDRVVGQPAQAAPAGAQVSAEQEGKQAAGDQLRLNRLGLGESVPEGSSEPVTVAGGSNAGPEGPGVQRLAGLDTRSNQERGDAAQARTQRLGQVGQAMQELANRQAAEPKEATPPNVDNLIALLQQPGALRTPEQKVQVDSAKQALTPQQFDIVQRAATNGSSLSAIERLQLRRMREGDIKFSETRDAPAESTQEPSSESPATTQEPFTHLDTKPVDAATLPDQRAAKPEQMSKQSHRFIRLLAAVFGKKVELFSSDHADAPDGYVMRGDRKTIYLNAAKSQQAHLVVFGHEVFHQLARENPKAYEAVKSVLKLREGAKTDVKGIHGDMEELTADVVGNHFADPSFWTEVFGHMATPQAKALGESISKTVGKFQRVMGGMRGFQTSEMVENIGDVRKAISKAFADYTLEKHGEARNLAGESVPADNSTESAQADNTSEERVQNPDNSRQVDEFRAKRENGAERARTEMGARFSEVRENNASGESAASLEALSRNRLERAAGRERVRVRRDGTKVPLIGPDAVDARARAGSGDVILQRGVGRNEWTVLDQDPALAKHAVARALSVVGAQAKFSEKRDQTSTLAFKNWFGDSVAVGRDGKPLVFFHGTRSDFSIFKQDAPASHLKLPGLFFTTDGDTASTYSHPREEGANVMPVYLRLENPARIDASDMTAKEATDALNEARSAGHDGAILEGVGITDHPEYVVFAPEQVKSAIGNNGEYSGSNPDIRYSTTRDGEDGEPTAAAGGQQHQAVPGPRDDAQGYGTAIPGAHPPVTAWHFSGERRSSLSSAAYGTGLKGSGREQFLNAEDPRSRKRIYFYIDKGQGIHPESGVGAAVHEVQLNNVYDFDKDPQGLRRGTDWQAFETALMDAGFDGYLYRSHSNLVGAAILLGPRDVPVEYRGLGKEATQPGKGVSAEDRKPVLWQEQASGPNQDMQDMASRLRSKDSWAQHNIRVAPGKAGFSRVEVKPKQAAALVNVGLSTVETKGGGSLTPEMVRQAFESMGLAVESEAVHTSNTEPTAVLTLDRPLTQAEGDKLSEELGQEAIVQRLPNGSGEMFGPKAEEWGPYDPTQFLMPNGKFAEERLQASEKRDITVPERVAAAGSLENAQAIAASQKWKTNRDFKMAIQNAVLAVAGAHDLTRDTPKMREFLVRRLLQEARAALITNANAVGWYNEKVTTALEIVSAIHPELKTDPQAKFAFIWALAVTSNGIKVDKNFELAERAYREWKASAADPADRRMPTSGIGMGPTKSKIHAALKVYNDLMRDWGYERFQKFATTLQPNKQIEALYGRPVSGEGANTEVYGAGIVGPKIGNGFFMNLYGEFGQLTMDRWWVRMWGRITGQLVDTDKKKIASSKDSFVSIIEMIKADRVATRAVEQAIGARLGKGSPEAMAKKIANASSKEEVRDALKLVFPANPERETRLTEIRGKKPKEFVSVGDELRKSAKGYINALDGQIEVPGGSRHRDMMRAISRSVLAELQKEHPHLTMADFQALLWYPEKTLYDAAGVEVQDEDSENGYEDAEAPDYANAAAKLARQRGLPEDDIQAAIDRASVVIEAGQRAKSGGRSAVGVPGPDRAGDGELPEQPQPEPRKAEELTQDELTGREIKVPVKVEETGETVTLTMDAGHALNDINEREDAMRRLIACVSK